MNIEELKRRADILERELQSAAAKSQDVAAFAKYQPLVSAISRAKAGKITIHEELPGMRYWMFETDIPDFPSVELGFSRFHLLLRGLERWILWRLTASKSIGSTTTDLTPRICLKAQP